MWFCLFVFCIFFFLWGGMLEEGKTDTFDFNEENITLWKNAVYWFVVTSFKIVFYSGETCFWDCFPEFLCNLEFICYLKILKHHQQKNLSVEGGFW